MTKIERLITRAIPFAHAKPVALFSAWLRRLFVAPVFSDPDKTQQARLTHVLLQVSFTVVTLLCLVTLFDTTSPLSPWLLHVCLFLNGLLIIAFVLLRKGFVRLANQMLNIGVLGIFTYEAVFVDRDIHSVGYGLLYLAVIHAGILLGRRAAFLTAGFIVLLGIVLQYAKQNGLLPIINAIPSDYFRVTAYGGALTIAASLIYLATESMHRAIVNLRQNEAAQAEITRRLQYEISERRAHEREQAAVLAMASAMRKAVNYEEIVPVILNQTLEIFGGCASALSRFSGHNNEQIFEFAHGAWQTWQGSRLTHFPDWDKSVIGNSTIYLNNTVAQDIKFPFATQLNGANAVALVLLEGTEVQIGALWLGGQQAITLQDLQILAAIGNMVANALQRIQSHAETRNRVEQLAAINRLGQFIAETLDLAKIYEKIGETTRTVLPEMSDLFIELYNAEENVLDIVYSIQNGQQIDINHLTKVTGLVHEVTSQGKAALARPLALTMNALVEPRPAALEIGTKASAYVPMAARGEVVGILYVSNKTLHRFSPIDLEFLTLLANTAAIFIQNALLFKDLQQSNQRAQAELAERKQAEATIRRHLTAMESSIDGIAMLDNSQTFIYVNYAFAHLYGYQHPDELIGQPWPLFYTEEANQVFEQTLLPELTHTGRWRGETTGQRRDGSTFQQEVSLVRLETGEITAVVRDITERKDAEAALQRSQKLESLGVLAGGIAHDFNNFLAGLLGQISLARAKLLPEDPAYRHIEKAITSATRAADLTRQLLAYAGKSNFLVSQVNINELIRENMNLLEAILPKQVQLNFKLGPDLPMVEGDVGQIQQVIMNLIMNAAEAVGEAPGYVQVESQLRTLTAGLNTDTNYVGADQLAPGAYVCVSVHDNGAGMEKKVLDRIFDPFFSTKGQGRGLGLSATLGIIRSHKGGLQVESQIGVGSTFQVLLPIITGPVQVAYIAEDPITEKLEGAVLLVDDEETVLEALGEILEIAGLRVLKADNGQAGVKLFQAHQQEISTVVLDVHMPVMNGLDALEALKAIDPSVDVILSSGYSEYSIAEHLLNQPNISFLQKPYPMETAIQLIAERLNKKRKR